MSAAKFMIFGGLGCAALMLAVGVGVQMVDEHGGVEGIAASAEAMRQDVREAVLPDVQFSMADMLADPAIEKALAERGAAGGGALPFRQQALAALMNGAQRQLMEAQLQQMCGPEAAQQISARDCEIARNFVNTDFTQFGPGGQYYAGLTGADPAAQEDAFKALYGTIGMDEKTYQQVFKDVKTQ
jgi:hypothetical protein